MTERSEARIRAAVVELAEASPLPPAMPWLDAPRSRRRRWIGPTVAAAVFAAVIAVAAVVVAFGSPGRWVTGDQAAPVVLSEGAVPIAVPVGDGRVVDGALWPGGDTGIVIVPSFGEGMQPLVALADDLNRAGYTVLLYELWGQSPRPDGEAVAAMVPDLVDVVADLRTRGVGDVVLLGVRHGASAAIEVADGADAAALIALYPFESYRDMGTASRLAASGSAALLIGSPQVADSYAAAFRLWSASGRRADLADPVSADLDDVSAIIVPWLDELP